MVSQALADNPTSLKLQRTRGLKFDHAFHFADLLFQDTDHISKANCNYCRI